MGGPERKVLSGHLLLVMAILLLLSSTLASAQIKKKTWADGEQDWNIPQKHRLFFSGNDELDTNLSDIHPFNTNAGGTITVNQAGVPQTIFESIQSSPVSESLNLTLNLSAYIHATATDSPLSCASWQRPTQMFLDVNIGGQQFQFESEAIYIIETSVTNAHNFTFERQEINVKMDPGDSFEATLRMLHDCPVAAKLWWSGVTEDGGLVIEGQWLEPDVRIVSDDLGFSHVDMVALGPWAIDGYRSIVMEVWGPMDPDDAKPVDRESILEIMDGPQAIRKVEENRTAWTYVTPRLGEGHWLLQFCMKTNDQPYTAVVGECHFKGWVHIVNGGEVDDGWSATAVLAPFSFAMVLLWLGWGIKQGILYPAPLMGIMMLMALMMIPLALQMPDIAGSDERIQTGWPAPQFVLNSAGNNSSAVSLEELLDGKEAAVLAVSVSGSPNQKQHIDVLDMVDDKMGDRVGIAMLVTGEEVAPYELEELSEDVFSRWPIMIDEHNAATAKLLPTGMADGIIVIDSTGHIAWWSVGSTSLESLENAVDDISYGSSQGPSMILALIWTASFPLILTALPQKEWEKPEEPLPPGGNWGGIITTGGIGFMVVGLPLLILGLTGLSGETWYLVQLFFAVFLLYQAISTMIWGAPFEIKRLGSLLHRLSPTSYREWKPKEEVTVDVQSGMWVAWFSWLIHPMLIPQGLSNTLLTSGFGLFMGIILIVATFICSGVVVLAIRVIAEMGGRLAVMVGQVAREDMHKLFGSLMIPFAIWFSIDLFLKAQGIGFFT
ncbi:MAG: hypothetical protein QF707_05850 [Candidatus Poseidoniaceae archaeon]|jgi:hypothetical protein|nr:hypothetical protein [Candidatus Poseidoniaceae archaeon]MDP7203455.1 hypothetical protein [Candidatus Poseidoniaceae archaeon]